MSMKLIYIDKILLCKFDDNTFPIGEAFTKSIKSKHDEYFLDVYGQLFGITSNCKIPLSNNCSVIIVATNPDKSSLFRSVYMRARFINGIIDDNNIEICFKKKSIDEYI